MTNASFRQRFHSPTIEHCEPRRLFSGTFTAVDLADFRTEFPNETLGAGLVADAAGDLFGTALVLQPTADRPGGGDLYEVDAVTHAVSVRHAFTLDEGAPTGLPLLDDQGDIFETAGNRIYEIPAGTDTPVRLATLDGTGGVGPSANGNLVRDAAGDLFGTTYDGGAFATGTVFEVPAGSASAVLIASSATVVHPNSLAIDAAGNLYGTSFGTGIVSGALFRIPVGTTGYATVTPLVAATTASVAVHAYGPLLIRADGTVLGSEFISDVFDKSDLGTVFQIPAGTTTPTPIYTFPLAGGVQPTGPLSTDAAGDLFGVASPNVTNAAYPHDHGILYELPGGVGPIVTVYTADPVEGTLPTGSVAVTSDGALAAVAAGDGQIGHAGSIFEMFPSGSGFATTITASTSVGSGSAQGGTDVTLTAQVTASVGVYGKSPTGTITFTDAAGDVLGTAYLLNGVGTIGNYGDGVVTLVTDALPVGQTTVIATYNGDATYAVSRSTPVPVTITPPPTPALVTLTAVQDPTSTIQDAAEVTVTVHVASAEPGGPIPTGKVSFAAGTLTLDATGSAAGTVFIGAGVERFTATYAGDADNGAATATPVLLTLTVPGLTPSLVSDPLPAQAMAGAAIRRPIRVRISDPGPPVEAAVGTAYLYAYATTDPAYNPESIGNLGRSAPAGISAVALGTTRIPVRAGQTRVASIPLATLPPELGAGTYYLLVGISSDGEADNSFVAATPITVSAPAVSLSAAVAPAGTASLRAGHRGTVLVTVTNAAAAAFKGPVRVEVGLTADQATPAAQLSYRDAVVRVLSLAPGRRATLRMSFATSADGDGGTSYPFAIVIADGITSNVIGANPFQLT